MARKKKSSDTEKEAVTEIVDAVVVEEDQQIQDNTAEADPVQEDAPEVQEEPAEAAEADGADAPEEAPEQDAEAQEDGPADPPIVSAPAPEQVVVRKGGFVPLVLGGVAAAAIGFGAARYVLPEGWPWPGTGNDEITQQVQAVAAAQDTKIDALGKQIAGLDLSGIAANGDAIAALGQRLDAVDGTLSALQGRVDALESRPVGDGTSGADLSAFQAELAALKQTLATQRAEIDAITSDALAKREEAALSAREAMIRASLSRIQTALDSGADFTPALDDLAAAGVEVPAGLAEVSTGAPTLASLQSAFPDAARAALSAARKAAPGSDGGGLGGFLRNQLGVRSLAPKEGSDPDAVLSRAEAALREGRLTDVLAEIEALPEEGRTPLANWVADASTRQNALVAAETLGQSLTSN